MLGLRRMFLRPRPHAGRCTQLRLRHGPETRSIPVGPRLGSDCGGRERGPPRTAHPAMTTNYSDAVDAPIGHPGTVQLEEPDRCYQPITLGLTGKVEAPAADASTAISGSWGCAPSNGGSRILRSAREDSPTCRFRRRTPLAESPGRKARSQEAHVTSQFVLRLATRRRTAVHPAAVRQS